MTDEERAHYIEIFPKLVKKAIDAGKTRDLCNHFGTVPSTVNRWANGIANPHPVFKRLIVHYIYTLVPM